MMSSCSPLPDASVLSGSGVASLTEGFSLGASACRLWCSRSSGPVEPQPLRVLSLLPLQRQTVSREVPSKRRLGWSLPGFCGQPGCGLWGRPVPVLLGLQQEQAQSHSRKPCSMVQGDGLSLSCCGMGGWQPQLLPWTSDMPSITTWCHETCSHPDSPMVLHTTC